MITRMQVWVRDREHVITRMQVWVRVRVHVVTRMQVWVRVRNANKMSACDYTDAGVG